MFSNFVTFGLYVKPWENLEYTPWKSVGAFESKVFKPEEWHETYQFLPIRMSLPDDDYWAVKVIGALTEEHFRLLVEAAQYPEPGAAEYMIKTLMERRQKCLQYFLKQVSPVEFKSIENGKIIFQDISIPLISDKDQSDSEYNIRFFDDEGNEIAERFVYKENREEITVEISSETFDKSNGYLRIDVLAVYDDLPCPEPAQFHLSGSSVENLHLVGVVH